MLDNVPQNKLEIKHSGLAVECGTLEVLLSFLTSSPVLVMPLERECPINHQNLRQWAIHVTARPVSSGPVYYCTFAAAEVIHLGPSATLTFPFQDQFGPDVAMERGAQLQQDFVRCISTLLRISQRASKIVMPARYRLPDEWVWSARGKPERIQFRENHWLVVR